MGSHTSFSLTDELSVMHTDNIDILVYITKSRVFKCSLDRAKCLSIVLPTVYLAR